MEAAAEARLLFLSGFISRTVLGRSEGVCVCPTDTPVLMEHLFRTHRFISEVSSSFQLLLLCCYKSSLTDSALLIQVSILSSAQSAHTPASTRTQSLMSATRWMDGGLLQGFFFCFLTSLCLFKDMSSQYFVDWASSHVCSHSCTSAVLEDKRELQDNNSIYGYILFSGLHFCCRVWVCLCLYLSGGLFLDLHRARKAIH